MPQVLEAPWNGVALDGGLPNVSAPTTSSNPFYFLHQRNIKRVRVYLNPRVVMPVGTSTIPAGVVTQLTNIANAAVATVSGVTLASKIEWALQGSTEPTSTTESRRPRVGWVENFWEKVDDVVGGMPATWGYAVLTQPRVVDMWEANADPDASMTAFANVSWAPTEDPWVNTAPWLEVLTREVAAHLRAQGATKNIVVPTVYHPSGSDSVRGSHPQGPWIDDANVWYEATVTPMGADGYTATKTYAAYEADAALLDYSYRDVWHESAYFTQQAGASAVLDPLDLNPPTPLELPPAVPQGAVALPPTALTATTLNGGALVAWTQPTFFGDGTFTHYQVEVVETANPQASFVSFRVPEDLAINAGPFMNGVTYTASVYTVTTEGFSDSASVQFTPSLSAPNPVGGWYQQPTDDGVLVEVVTLPEPSVQAFPAERNFRPANWGKLPSEVPEGF